MKEKKKFTDDDRLREIGKRLATKSAESLVLLLEGRGAKASIFLRPKEQAERWNSTENVCIPVRAADTLAAILLSLPRAGQRGARKLWSVYVENYAMWELHKGKPLRTLAQEISEVTGQPISSTRRRLQEMEKKMQEQRAKVRQPPLQP